MESDPLSTLKKVYVTEEGKLIFTGTPRRPKREDGETTIYTRGAVNRRILAIKAEFMPAVSVIMDAPALDKIRALSTLHALVRAIETLPEPTKANTRWRNTDILIDLRDELLARPAILGQHRLYKGAANFVIIIYDYDPYYQQRIDAIYDWWRRTPWNPDTPEANLIILRGLRDRFFAMENNGGRDGVFRLFWRLAIMAYSIPPLRKDIDSVLESWRREPWEEREPERPRPPTWLEFATRQYQRQ